jgi:hypothetical protein
MDKFLNRLPIELGKEIFSYLLPNIDTITFQSPVKRCYHDYCNSKYENAYINKQIYENEEGYYLSRICKKNGKHRYYITQQMDDVMEVESNDYSYNMYMYEYRSKYVGKNLKTALLTLLYDYKNIMKY